MRRKSTTIRDPHRCENCTYYRQHYTMEEKQGSMTFTKIVGGHCTMPGLKYVVKFQTCEGFKDKLSGED